MRLRAGERAASVRVALLDDATATGCRVLRLRLANATCDDDARGGRALPRSNASAARCAEGRSEERAT